MKYLILVIAILSIGARSKAQTTDSIYSFTRSEVISITYGIDSLKYENDYLWSKALQLEPCETLVDTLFKQVGTQSKLITRQKKAIELQGKQIDFLESNEKLLNKKVEQVKPDWLERNWLPIGAAGVIIGVVLRSIL
jgi:hypothetical protein